MKEIKAYECDHCCIYKKTKHTIKKHEERCFSNPETRSCATCIFNEPDWSTGGNKCLAKGVDLFKGTLTTNCELHQKQEIYNYGDE